MTTVTHALPWILAAGLVTRVASWFGWLASLDLAIAAAILGCQFATMYHLRSAHLCMRCMDEVPADAPVQAERRKRVLWFSHQIVTGVGIFGLLVPAAAIAFIGNHFGSQTIQHLTRIPADILLFTSLYSTWLHHRLRPWCPYCHDWDEDGDPETSPDPSEFKTRAG